MFLHKTSHKWDNIAPCPVSQGDPIFLKIILNLNQNIFLAVQAIKYTVRPGNPPEYDQLDDQSSVYEI